MISCCPNTLECGLKKHNYTEYNNNISTSTTTTTASTSMSSSIPLLSQIGQYAKDLTKSQFSLTGQEAHIVAHSKNGVTIEHGVLALPPPVGLVGLLRTSMNTTYKGITCGYDNFGYTNEIMGDSTTCYANGFAKGAVNITSSFATRSPLYGYSNAHGTLNVSYSGKGISSSTKLLSDLKIHNLDQNISIGSGNISVGLRSLLRADSTNFTPSLNTVDVGAQYTSDDYIASVHTELNRKRAIATYFQRVTPNQSVAISAETDLGQTTPDRSLFIANQFLLSPLTTLKSRIHLPSARTDFFIEHRLFKPLCTIGVKLTANPINIEKGIENYGVSVRFGDY